MLVGYGYLHSLCIHKHCLILAGFGHSRSDLGAARLQQADAACAQDWRTGTRPHPSFFFLLLFLVITLFINLPSRLSSRSPFPYICHDSYVLIIILIHAIYHT